MQLLINCIHFAEEGKVDIGQVIEKIFKLQRFSDIEGEWVETVEIAKEKMVLSGYTTTLIHLFYLLLI